MLLISYNNNNNDNHDNDNDNDKDDNDNNNVYYCNLIKKYVSKSRYS